MICPKCGTDNPDGSKFCMACGERLAPAPDARPAGDAEATRVVPGRQASDTAAAQPDDVTRKMPPASAPEPQQAPTSAYDRLGTDYQTPQTVYGDGGKKPHKGHAGAIVAAVVVVLVVAAVAVAVAFPQVLPEPVRSLLPGAAQQEQSAVEPADDQGEAAAPSDGSAGQEGQEDGQAADGEPATGAATTGEGSATTPREDDGATASGTTGTTAGNGAPSGSNSKYAYLVGSWTGVADSVSSCVNATADVPTLVVKSVDDSDVVTFDVKVNFHNHGGGADNTGEGDVWREYDGVRMTTSQGGFSYKGNVSDLDSGDSLEIEMDLGTSDGAKVVKMTVRSNANGSYHSDTYLMTKDA